MPESRDDYLQPYRQAEGAFGGQAFDVTLWASETSQQKRFEVFAAMLNLTGKRLLDAGCGRGDFAAYLARRRIRFASFIGVDALEQVIAFANQRRLRRCRFVAGDFVENPSLLATDAPEIITLSGTLNTMDPDTTRGLLDGAWRATSQVLAFNFLADTAGPLAPQQEWPAKRLDTRALLDFAFERTWNVRFRQDYFRHGHDATIVMTKP